MEHVGANMGIQIPLLVIDRRGVSVMSISTSQSQHSKRFFKAPRVAILLEML